MTTKAAQSSSEKRIVLEINGSGGISIDSKTNPDDVWSVVQPKFRREFMSILEAEMAEEGDRSYKI